MHSIINNLTRTSWVFCPLLSQQDNIVILIFDVYVETNSFLDLEVEETIESKQDLINQ